MLTDSGRLGSSDFSPEPLPPKLRVVIFYFSPSFSIILRERLSRLSRLQLYNVRRFHLSTLASRPHLPTGSPAINLSVPSISPSAHRAISTHSAWSKGGKYDFASFRLAGLLTRREEEGRFATLDFFPEGTGNESTSFPCQQSRVCETFTSSSSPEY
ncbi:hypothetical protein EI94DRAFT_232251 [Lactarius quietus]|nr:hypothetical protein EI94DRAFT_232251 [Lactarius quietus]